MREEDEAKQKVEREALMESEVTGEGIIEACVTATSSGQTQQEAIDTIQMIFMLMLQPFTTR